MCILIYNCGTHMREWGSRQDILRLTLCASSIFGEMFQFALWPKTGKRRCSSRVNEAFLSFWNKLMENQLPTCIFPSSNYTEKEEAEYRVAGNCRIIVLTANANELI